MALANIEFIQYMHQLLETQVIDCYVITCTNILLMLVFDIIVFLQTNVGVDICQRTKH